MTILHWVALAALQTSLFWMPYVLERMFRHGIAGAVANPPPGGFEAAAWAHRARAAHANATENLAVFAVLALVAHLSDAGTQPLVLLAGQVFVCARLVHFIVYTLGVPWLRTLAFVGGFVAEVLLAVEVLR